MSYSGYKIVTEIDVWDLNRTVLDELRAGWEPIGGMSTSKSKSWGGQTEYHQTLVMRTSEVIPVTVENLIPIPVHVENAEPPPPHDPMPWQSRPVARLNSGVVVTRGADEIEEPDNHTGIVQLAYKDYIERFSIVCTRCGDREGVIIEAGAGSSLWVRLHCRHCMGFISGEDKGE